MPAVTACMREITKYTIFVAHAMHRRWNLLVGFSRVADGWCHINVEPMIFHLAGQTIYGTRKSTDQLFSVVI